MGRSGLRHCLPRDFGRECTARQQPGNLVGTIIALVVANLWARKTGRPSSIVLIPAIVLLVSGSIGFRGLVAMAGGDFLLGAGQFLQMFVVAMTIFAGIVVGHTIVRPESGL